MALYLEIGRPQTLSMVSRRSPVRTRASASFSTFGSGSLCRAMRQSSPGRLARSRLVRGGSEPLIGVDAGPSGLAAAS